MSEFKSERRERQRKRRRYSPFVNGRPTYLLMQVGGIFRHQRAAYKGLDSHEKMVTDTTKGES